MYDDALTQNEQDKAHSSVRVDVLCVEDSHGCHVVIGVGRVIVQRSQTACCDRQFFPAATYCTLFHRANGSFEVFTETFVNSCPSPEKFGFTRVRSTPLSGKSCTMTAYL